jgi:hypothetical protein
VIVLLALLAMSDAGARSELAAGVGSASYLARQPVHFSIHSYAADVEVALSPSGSVLASASGVRLRLIAGGGDRVEVEFGGKRQLHDGKVRVELPRGSAVDAGTVSGSVTVIGVGGDARVRGMSGQVHIRGAAEVDVETVDGNVEVAQASGAVRVHTVSGATAVDASQAAVKLEVETASGPVDFRGPCGAGCHMDIDSVSGEVRFSLDRASSLSARVVSTSGKVSDDLGLALRRKPDSPDGDFSEGALGSGEGLIECETFSGNVTLRPR